MKKTTLSIVILVGVVVGAVGFLLGTLVTSPSGSPSNASAAGGPGAVYETPVPVADFTLTNQKNQPFTFSSTRGKVVLMAFLFTHCGDVCPFSAIKMRLALEQLGAQGSQVELVVISTDPARDTVPIVADYSRDLGLYDRWQYLTGSVEELQKLYKQLKITVIKAEVEEVQETAKSATELGITLPSKDRADSPVYGLTDEQIMDGSRVTQKYAGGYDIAHSAPFWVIDPEGRVRTSLDVSATPVQLVEAIQAYLPR